jgi:hypothetical protein
MLASALLLVTGAAGAAPVSAAEDQTMIRLHSPCHRALVDEQEASRRLQTQNPSPADAVKTLDEVAAGLDWNEHACGSIANRSREQNDVRGQMYLVNKAFLLSLRGEAEQVLGRPSAATSFALAKPLLRQCAAWAKLPRDVRSNCTTQIANNDSAQRVAKADTSDPCQVALQAAKDAGDALRGKDTASFETAYRRTTAGLAANKNCTKFPQMRLVNDAFLRSYKTVADRDLNVPFARDSDIANPADPFKVPNDELVTCGAWSAAVPDNAAANCRALLDINRNRLAPVYAQQDALAAGAPLPTMDWPYPIAAGYTWDTPGNNLHNEVFADEEVRGASGWTSAAKGQEIRRDPAGDYVIFAAVRNWKDLHSMFDFSANKEPFGADFFSKKMLLVAIQHKPDQHCDIRVNNVTNVAREAGTIPAVRVDYTLACDPPGTQANTVVKVLPVDATNGQVSFVEDGGSGPSGTAPAASR